MNGINKKDLKAFVRYDGSGRVVAGSLILRRQKPKVGKWTQVQGYECCTDRTLTTTVAAAITNFRVKLFCGAPGVQLLPATAGWTAGAGWAGNNTTGYVHTAGSVATLSNAIVALVGRQYTIGITITSRTAGSISVAFGV